MIAYGNKRLIAFASVLLIIGSVLQPWTLSSAFAQTMTGGLRGVVTDAAGAVVPGASVVAKNAATNVEYKTTATGDGVYAIPRIPLGKYTLAVEAQGFKKAEHTGIEVAVGKDTVIDIKLEAGTITETVTVTGGSEVLIEKDSVQISATFQSRKITDLPVAPPGTGLDRIALLVPGVTPGFGNVNANGTTLSVNGNRARANNFTIDGVDNNDLSIGGPNYFVQSSAAVAEFQVITNNFSAEYGRNQGAIINIITRTGGNEFHGSGAWGHLDRKNFDTLTNIERRSGQKNPTPNLLNSFDYTIGGPIVKNRAFFFNSGHFIRNPGVRDLRTTGLAPTTAGIQALKAAFPNNPAVQYYADYSAFSLPIGNPTIRPDVAQSTLTVGTVTVPVAAVQRFVKTPARLDEYIVRGDANVTGNDRVWGRYLFQDQPNPDANVDVRGWTYNVPVRTQQAGGGWTRNISTRSLNEFRFNYSRLFVIFGGGGSGGKGNIPHPDDIDKALTFFSPLFTAANGGPILSVGPATNLPQGRTVESFQIADSFVLTSGRHQMKFGFDYRRLRNSVPFLPNVNGNFTYSTGQQLADNRPSSLQVALGPASLSYTENDKFFYFQDDWRVRPNLTLNLGLRYENTGQPINLLNQVTTAAENDPKTALWRQNLPLDARTVPQIPTDKNNWAPRVGLVYSPNFESGILGRLFGQGKTTIRGGLGVAYDAAFYNLMLNISTSSPTVFLTTVTGLGIPDAVPTGDKVRNAAVNAGAIRFNTFDPRFFNRTIVKQDFRSPYSQQWSLGIQRELFRDHAMEVRYVGNHQVGLFQTINPNPFVGNLVNGFSRTYNDPATNTVKTITFPGFPQLLPSGIRPLTCTDNAATPDNEAACNGRLFPYGVARERINGAQASYHGLQTRFDARLRSQWTYGITYTWSHAIDNSSEVFAFAGGNSTVVAQNPLDITRGERGNSGFDNRHVFTAHWIWDLPFMKDQRGIVGRIVGGWQFNGILRVQNQRRFTPIQQNTNRNPYEDSASMGAFYGSQSQMRPFSGNPNAPVNTVAITDVDACIFFGRCGATGGQPNLRTSPTGFYSMNDLNRNVFTPVTPNDVRYIINGPGAALKFGTPFGNIGRNTFTGDRLESLDLGIFKNIRITERIRLQYRLDMFNALNHPNFGIPNSILLDNAGRTFFNFQENDGGRRTLAMGLSIHF
jgi:outer membrane receptor protein involved in Fe transport